MKQPKCCSNEQAFTIVELLTGLVIAGVIVTAGIALSSMIQRSSREDLLSMANISKIDVALDQIIDEVNQSQKILTTPAEVQAIDPSCSVGNGTMFLAFLMPPQAFSKADYNIDYSKGVAKTYAEQNATLCPVVIGLRNPTGAEQGPYVLYRHGPSVNRKGYYQPATSIPVRSLSVLDGINTLVSGTPKSCTTGWTRRELHGMEACVDPHRKAVQISVTKRIPTTDASAWRPVKRTNAGNAQTIDNALIADAGVPSGGSGTSGCFFGICPGNQGQDCDGTVYYIDNSGSMGLRSDSRAPGGFVWDPLGANNRMEKAKAELLTAIASCKDSDKINIYYFNSTHGRYSSDMVRLGDKRNAINNWVRNTIKLGGMTEPWGGMNELVRNPNVKQVIVLTDGEVSSSSGSCFTNARYMAYADCYANYNSTTRATNPVRIDSVALDTKCANWLGALSTKNSGRCQEART